MGPSTTLDPPPLAPARAERPRDRVAAHSLATEIARTHGDALLRAARRYAGDPDDAHDAYQRALELLLEHAATIDRAKALPWMHVVVRREASALRRRHDRHTALDAEALDHHASDRTDDELDRIDLAQRAGEALASLKDAEAQALCLRAQGLSYEEIGEAYGWSYTKVNRAVSEGRRAFVDHYLGAERGDVCAQAGDRIGAYLAGELRSRDQVRMRAHLTRCPACRAQLHAERTAGHALQALLPPAVVTASDRHGLLHDHVMAPLTDLLGRLSPAADHALGAKLGAVALTTAALAGGGVTVQHEVSRHQQRPPAMRAALTGGATTTNAAAGSTTAAPATQIVGSAADGGRELVAADQRRAAAAAAAKRRAAAHRAAKAKRARQRAAASREFSPATTEFGSSTSTAASRSASRSSTSSGSSTTSAPQTAAASPVEVPVDASSTDSGIGVSGETDAP